MPGQRRRGDDLVRAIHDAVIAEFNETGLGRLSMEGIARRAATAKTVLYRRWNSPRDLLLDALYHLMPQEQPRPGADDLRGDLIAALRMLRDWMATPGAKATMALLMEDTHRPEMMSALNERVFDPKGSRFTLTVLRHYAGAGVVDPARITPIVADLGEALVFKIALDHNRPVTDEELAAVVDQAILPALGLDPQTPTTSRAT